MPTTKLPPPKPPLPLGPVGQTRPIKPLQGVSKTRAGPVQSGKAGYPRNVIFVTRKSALGGLMGKCRSLVVDEGYTSLTLHALGPAISHALLLLHALLDLLPYPKGDKGMWYEIKTGTVACVDEVDKEKEGEDEEEEWLRDVGAVEAAAPERKTRLKSSTQITLHISSRSAKRPAREGKPKQNRPSKRARANRARRVREEEEEEQEEEEEEDALNA
ncbi:hypothetical protein IAR50_001544 [Cryptococcus sp. DSM 104548]